MSEIHVPQSVEESIPLPKSGTFLRPNQIDRMNGEIKELEKELNDPRSEVQNRGMLVTRLKSIKHDLDSQTPPDLNPQQRDAAARRLAVLEEEISETMPTQEEMRRSPHQAVTKQVRFNQTMTGKALEAKNLLLMLNKGSTEPGIANLERLRRRGTDFNLEDALIQAKTFVGVEKSPAYEAGWEETFGQQSEKIQRLEKQLDALREELAANSPPPKNDEKKFTATCGACGKIARGKTQPRADFGLRGHQKYCRQYLASVATPDGEPQQPAA